MEETRAPAGAALETVREVLAAHGVRGEDPALARAMPEDSMGEILGRVNDAESYAPVILELGLFGGLIAEREFFACRTVGDLVATLERAAGEDRPRPTRAELRRHGVPRAVRPPPCARLVTLLLLAGIVWCGARLLLDLARYFLR